MSELLDARLRFTADMAKLVTYANSLAGYGVTANEILRTQAQANANAASGAGISNSLHLRGLAIDLNLYLDGVYQTASESYRALGDYWKSLGPDHYWGGDFHSRPDGNHFSLSPDGGATR